MNCVVLMGRLTRDPETRYTQDGTAVARYTLAVDRNGRDGADFISCVAFGKGGEFAERWLRQGMRITMRGHIQTGKYTNREGRTIYTTDVIADQQEFAQSKSENGAGEYASGYAPDPYQTRQEYRREPYPEQAATVPAEPYRAPDDEFMKIPEGIDEELPFM